MQAAREEKEHLDNCPFCRIIQGKDTQTERILYRDENFIAMFDSHPRAHGHFIVFPARHFSELQEMTPWLGQFFEKVQALAQEVTQKLGAPAYVLKLNNNIYRLDPDPNHVGHVHMHVLPTYAKPEQAGGKPAEPSAMTVDREYYLQLFFLLQGGHLSE